MVCKINTFWILCFWMTFISVTQSDDGYVRHRTSRCMTSLIYLFLKRNTRKKDKGHLLGGEVPNHKRELKEKVGGCLPLGAPCCITVLACSQHTPILGRDIASQCESMWGSCPHMYICQSEGQPCAWHECLVHHASCTVLSTIFCCYPWLGYWQSWVLKDGSCYSK